MRQAYDLEGIDVEYRVYPAARSFKLALTGILDGTIPWAKRAGHEVDFGAYPAN